MWLRTIWRFIVSALVLIATAYVVPGFSIRGANFVSIFFTAIIAAVVISILGFLVEKLFGEKVSPQGRGIISFLVAAAVIYVTQFFVGNFQVNNILAAGLAALIIGIVDAFIPTKIR